MTVQLAPDAQTYDCRKAFAETLIELARADERIVAVCNDSVGSSNLVGFREEFPDRLINVGIAEQDLVGVGAGLANGGLIPFVSAAAPFLTGRALEQIKADVAYSNTHVILCGQSPGRRLRRARPDAPLDRGPVAGRARSTTSTCSSPPTRPRPAPRCAGRSRTPARCTCACRASRSPRSRPRTPRSSSAARSRCATATTSRSSPSARWSRARSTPPSALRGDGISARVINMPFVDPLDEATRARGGARDARDRHRRGGDRLRRPRRRGREPRRPAPARSRCASSASPASPPPAARATCSTTSA